MSDREAFEKAYHKETGLYASWAPDNKGYTDVIAGMCYRIWQAAQAQAVNQQLLEALKTFVECWSNDSGFSNPYPEDVIKARAAIAAAQEQSK